MTNLYQYSITKALDYQSYSDLVKSLVQQKMTSGDNQSQSLVDYTKLNAARMKRWEKTYVPSEKVKAISAQVEEKETWLVLTEAWCGDAAQNIPILAKIADEIPSVDFKVIFRDENLELMDQFLTNGGRSIPKLIRLDKELNVLNAWGPRPKVLQEAVLNQKENPKMPQAEFMNWVHQWYAKDKGLTLEREMTEMLLNKESEVLKTQ